MPIFEVNIYTCTYSNEDMEILKADDSFKQIIVIKEVIDIFAVNEIFLLKNCSIRVHWGLKFYLNVSININKTEFSRHFLR